MDALSRVSPPFPCSHEPVNTSALPDRISSNKIANVLVFIPLSLSLSYFFCPPSPIDQPTFYSLAEFVLSLPR